MNLESFFSLLDTDKIMNTVESFFAETGSLLPASLGISSVLQTCVISILVFIGAGFLFRLVFGKDCQANQAISASVGILFVYAVTVAIYTLEPWKLSQYLSPLPFAIFRNDILIILPFAGSEFSLLCSNILSLVILCFIVHLLTCLLPTGHSFFGWFVFRVISIALAIFLNLTANWLINLLLPEGLALYAPIALLAVLVAALLIGLFNPLLCILFTVANPVIGLLYTFFFSNTIGKQLTKSVISTALLCGLFFVMEYLGYTVIDITSSALTTYLPFSCVLLFIWYIFDYKL